MAKRSTAKKHAEPLEDVSALEQRRIEYLPLDGLQGAARNPKQHALEDLGKSIERFGYVEPVVLDERTQRLVAGHGRVDALRVQQAAKQEPPQGVRAEKGRWLVPVLRGWASRSDTEAESYLLASNQLTFAGGWDDAGLADLVRELESLGAMEGLGFDEEEIGRILAGTETKGIEGISEEDAIPEVAEADVYVKHGEVWRMGPHLLAVGDCRDVALLERMLAGRKVNVCVTSPPYAAQREYDEESGFKPVAPDKYVAWFAEVASAIEKTLAPDGSYFLNIKEHCEDGQRHLYVKDLTLAHVRDWGWRFVDEFCWLRPGPPGSWPNRFKNSWEPIFHFSLGGSIRFRPGSVSEVKDTAYEGNGGTNMLADGGGHEGRSFLGEVLPSNTIRCSGVERDTGHTAAFPVGIPEFFVKAYSDEVDVVFDPFMGSGTTLIAAEKTGRHAIGTELSPKYVQVALERWEAFTGKKAEKVS